MESKSVRERDTLREKFRKSIEFPMQVFLDIYILRPESRVLRPYSKTQVSCTAPIFLDPSLVYCASILRPKSHVLRLYS